jgi:rubredoxin/mono/diheme cytochrome c family protein
MARYVCSVCGYVHDDAQEGTAWDDLPAGWRCPVCGAVKSQFQAVGDGASLAGLPGGDGPRRPRRAVLTHRVFGYVFLAIYLVLLVQMVPRLWSYQIEFPARTVLHIALGLAIGTALVLKIVIVRFFRRLDPSLVPPLGTAILVGSVVLIGISVPSAFREAAATGRLFAEENQQRVATLLAQTGLSGQQCAGLASPDSLRAGQRILRRQCVDCHDLRTVLARPRTPDNWRQTVRRMADRSLLVKPLEESEQWQVTAYLIALSPQLQRSAQQLREQQTQHGKVEQAAQKVVQAEPQAAAYDAPAARQLFESKCSQCHAVDEVDKAPPDSADAARELVAWMVDEGLEASEAELAQLVQYLTETYVKPTEQTP